MLKPPGIKLLKLKCDILVSISAFKLNLRRYTVELKTGYWRNPIEHGAQLTLYTLMLGERQGLTIVNCSAQSKPFGSHLPLSPCLIDWGKIMHPTYPTRCAYVELINGRV
jgi:hypothetical protein